MIGSLIGFIFKGLSHKWNDTVLGYCAGVMMAAAVVGLLLPAVEMSGDGWGIAWVIVGAMLGAMFLTLLDFVTPHLHHITGLEQEQHTHNTTLNHVMLFVMAIALHKLPEGIAAGVSFNGENLGDAWTVTFGIALQNIPEGMVVISPLLLAGVSRMRTFIISLGIGLLEVVGVLIGYFAGGISQAMLPTMLAFAGGAMLYVVSNEMIPETHSHGYQKQATYALLLGFLSILTIERAL